MQTILTSSTLIGNEDGTIEIWIMLDRTRTIGGGLVEQHDEQQ